MDESSAYSTIGTAPPSSPFTNSHLPSVTPSHRFALAGYAHFSLSDVIGANRSLPLSHTCIMPVVLHVHSIHTHTHLPLSILLGGLTCWEASITGVHVCGALRFGHCTLCSVFHHRVLYLWFHEVRPQYTLLYRFCLREDTPMLCTLSVQAGLVGTSVYLHIVSSVYEGGCVY